MTEPNNHKKYTLLDIEQYLQGKLSPAGMHELEKAALQDPFLADAIEGYRETQLSIVHSHLAGINQQLSSVDAAKYAGIVKPMTQQRWGKIAAAMILILGAATISWLLLNTSGHKKELAMQTIQTRTIDTIHKKNNGNTPIASLSQHATISKPQTINPRPQTIEHRYQSIAKNADKPVLKDREISASILAKDIAPGNFRSESLAPESRMLQKKSRAATLKDAPEEKFSPVVDALSAMQNKMVNTRPVLPIRQDTLHIRGTSTFGDHAALAGRVNRVQIKPSAVSLNIDSFPLNLNTPHSPNSGKTMFFYSGKLVGPDQKPVAGASIQVGNKRTNKPLLSRPDGSFAIGDTDSLMKIIISSVGYEQNKVTLVPGQNKPITLQPSGEALNEEIVTGYATARKKSMALISDREKIDSISPAGGWENFKKYLFNKISLTTAAQKEGSFGVIEMQLDIDENGKAGNVRIIRSFNNRLNDAIITTVSEGPNWITPGKKKVQNAVVIIQL